MRRELQANGHFGRLEANFRSLRIETWGLSGAEGPGLRLQHGKHYNEVHVRADACICVYVRMACASACVQKPRPLVTLVSGP